MQASTVTSKGQTTIPARVRKALHLHSGDVVVFEIKGNKAIIEKADPFDYTYHRALAKTLTEWESSADDEAYNDL
jgi:antitoxin PrlF